jgi:hypothetical protein
VASSKVVSNWLLADSDLRGHGISLRRLFSGDGTCTHDGYCADHALCVYRVGVEGVHVSVSILIFAKLLKTVKRKIRKPCELGLSPCFRYYDCRPENCFPRRSFPSVNQRGGWGLRRVSSGLFTPFVPLAVYPKRTRGVLRKHKINLSYQDTQSQAISSIFLPDVLNQGDYGVEPYLADSLVDADFQHGRSRS